MAPFTARTTLAPVGLGILAFMVAACAPSPERQLQRRMDALHSQAEHALVLDDIAGPMGDDGYEPALREWRTLQDSYASIATEHPNDLEAAARLRIVKRRIELLTAERNYKPLIDVRYVARGVDRASGRPGEVIFGEVRNLGKETIHQLEIRVELLGPTGEPVAKEQSGHPVLHLPGKPQSATDPLPPGHSRPFRILVDKQHAPSDWVECRARVVRVLLSREGAGWPPRGPS